jgi:hypothetical protein
MVPTHAADGVRKKNYAKIEAWLSVGEAPKAAAPKAVTK